MKSKKELQEAFKRGVSGERRVEMKCPLMSQPFESAPYQSKWHSIDCLEERYAWLAKGLRACAIALVEKALWDIATELGTIQVRLKREGKK